MITQVIVKLSRKHQIVVPRPAREALGLQAGDRVCFRVEEGSVSLLARPASMTAQARGLHQQVWSDIDPDAWLREERQAWPSAASSG
jgi:AbrB family looped-hinge helix DNA binding protein